MGSVRTKRASATGQMQRGSVLAEFVLVAPFILALAGYGLRFTQELQAQQLALGLSRELATDLFSKCVDITIQQVPAPTCGTALCVDVTSTQNAIQACINTIAQRYSAAWTMIAPASAANLDLTAEVYRYNLGSFDINTQAGCNQNVTLFRTRVNSSGVVTPTNPPPSGSSGIGSIPYADVCQRNRVARANLQFTITPLTSFLPGLPSADRTIIYEAIL
jgi:hypothetical protein